jgi:hypothetical protein
MWDTAGLPFKPAADHTAQTHASESQFFRWVTTLSLSSRPKRTRISYFAALARTTGGGICSFSGPLLEMFCKCKYRGVSSPLQFLQGTRKTSHGLPSSHRTFHPGNIIPPENQPADGKPFYPRGMSVFLPMVSKPAPTAIDARDIPNPAPMRHPSW